MKNLYYGSQYIDKDDQLSVSRSLKNSLITGGKNVEKFERSLKNYFGSKYVLTCSTGTAALDLCLRGLEIRKNENIIIPSINFISIYSMAINLGIKVYLSDVDEISGIMRPDLVEECIKKNNIKRVKAIVTMYLGGSPEYISDFSRLKKKYNCLIIEDACHAFGSSYNVKKNKFKIGSCKHSDIATFSFHPVKTITTGEGGAISTNNRNIFNRIKLLRSHGINRKNKYWEYDIKNLSNNYRLSDINCSLGLTQLKKLNFFIKRRKELANLYKKNLSNLKDLIILPKYVSKFSSWHLFIIKINFTNLKIDKDQLIKLLNKKNIYPQFHYIPIYKHSACKTKSNFKKLKNSEKYYKNNLSLPLHVNLTKTDINYICRILKKIIYEKQSS